MIAKSMQNDAIIIIKVRLSFKNDKYLTLAALIPSFSSSGLNSATKSKIENVINIKIDKQTIIQKNNPAQKNISITITRLNPSAIKLQ